MKSDHRQAVRRALLEHGILSIREAESLYPIDRKRLQGLRGRHSRNPASPAIIDSLPYSFNLLGVLVR